MHVMQVLCVGDCIYGDILCSKKTPGDHSTRCEKRSKGDCLNGSCLGIELGLQVLQGAKVCLNVLCYLSAGRLIVLQKIKKL